MKYFKLFIFLLVFCLTGCDVTYNLTITNDNMIESVNFWYSDNEANRQLLDQYLSVSHQAYFDMDTSLTHNYNQSKMSKDDKIGMNLNYSYENDDLQKSSLLSRCYYKKNVINTDTQIVINTEGPISCMYMDGVKEFDNLEINIITKLKVLENNADKVDGDTYTWIINEDNYKDHPINIKISKESKWKVSFWMVIVAIIIILLICVIFAYVTYLKNKKRNKI